MLSNEELVQHIKRLQWMSENEVDQRLRQHQNDLLSFLVELQHEHPHYKMELGRLWADKLGIAYVNLETTRLESKLSALLPKEFAVERQIVLLRDFDGVLTAAASHPEDPNLLQEIQSRVDQPVSVVFSFPGEILDAIEISYQSLDRLLSDLGGKENANIPL
jgi:hypothetical protein